jgi:hypothetical protein
MAQPSLARQITYRIAQGLRHLRIRSDPSVDAALKVLLRPEYWILVKRLHHADRAHVLRVHRGLVQQGYTNPDLLLAALLHDAGKVDEHGSVHLIHRTTRVLLGRLAPNRLVEIARHNGGWLGHGLYLAQNHARLGAELAREAGASPRTCWLIAHHDDGTIPGDDELKALQAIDARE